MKKTQKSEQQKNIKKAKPKPGLIFVKQSECQVKWTNSQEIIDTNTVLVNLSSNKQNFKEQFHS